MRTWATTFLSRVRGWLGSREVDQEFAQEMAAHLEMLTDENVRRGMAPEEARRAARVRLGGVTQLAETNRELRGLPLVDAFVQDAHYGLRMLRKNPGFTAVAVLTLALGIGANTAIFSVVYAVLLKPLPFANPEQLYTVLQAKPQEGIKGTAWSYLNLEDLRQRNRVFSEVAGSNHHQLTLTGKGEPAVVNTSVVTAEFFSVFEEAPLLGRIFTSADGKPGAPAVVILSENLWRGKFGGDPGVIGTSVDLDKRPFTVVGVMPARFRYPLLRESEQIWIPVAQDTVFSKFMEFRGGHSLEATARMKPGVTLEQARAELDGLAARLARDFPGDNAGWEIRMLPLQRLIAWDIRPALLLLLGAAGLVLLIACANLVNLLLARATSRAQEMALRATLGAGRARIMRQLLTESAVLCLLGGGAGVLMAEWGVRALGAVLPQSVPRLNPIQLDYSVLAFALFLSVFASCVVGMVPAFFAANSSMPQTLRESGGRTGEGAAGRRARNFFAATEVALAVVLLVGAGLLLRSFSKLTSVNPGFTVQHVVRAAYSLPRAQYMTPQQWAAFADQLMPRVQAEPGMQDSAAAVPLPIADRFVPTLFEIVDRPASKNAKAMQADFVSASPEYFRVMGVPLVAGRLFNERDVMDTPRVTIISQALARTYFPHENPLGQHLNFGMPTITEITAREIVGVVGDMRDVSLGADPGPMMYVPYAQAPLWGSGIVVRTALGPAEVAAALRREVALIDKEVPVSDIANMRDIVEGSLAEPRARTLLLALFAGMALVLAATGIFGVIAYSVACRTHEIGIRVALGASRMHILRMVSGETVVLTLAGLGVGIPAAAMASRLLGHMLFGVGGGDPATLFGVGLALLVVAGVAAYVPARRALRVDPVIALRDE